MPSLTVKIRYGAKPCTITLFGDVAHIVSDDGVPLVDSISALLFCLRFVEQEDKGELTCST